MLILFKVEDNGRGFNADEVMKLEPARRFGLAAMEERVEILGGCLTISSQGGQGHQDKLFSPH